jgi:hypothetical protein
MMKKEKKERKVQRTGALLCLLSPVKYWVFSDNPRLYINYA